MNTFGRTIGIFVLVLVCGGGGFSQELSTLVLPSEDEVYEALQLGQITYDHYLILEELIINGIDSTNRHLLDLIPNLSFFAGDSAEPGTELTQEQADPFESGSAVKKPQDRVFSGKIKYRYNEYMEDEGRSRYYTTLSGEYARRWTLDLRMRREYSGGERFISRSLRYNGDKTEVVAGSFSARFGLGSVVGYRGKLLSFDSELSDESFLFPDYGGYNGVYWRNRRRTTETQGLVSHVRDADYSVTTTAAYMELKLGRFVPGLSFSDNYVKNRISQGIERVTTGALHSRVVFRRGYVQAEFVFQDRDSQVLDAVVVEGRHKTGGTIVQFAFWNYADSFSDMTCGSKRTYLTRKDTIDAVGFEFTNYRSGQTGGLLKTVVDLSEAIRFDNSVIHGFLNMDSSRLDLLSRLKYEVSSDVSMTFDYLHKNRVANTAVSRLSRSSDQVRAEFRLRQRALYFRSYIGYTWEDPADEFWSAFMNARYTITRYGRVEMWLNVRQIDLSGRRVDYWYGYLQNRLSIWTGVAGGIKITHTYARGSADQHRTQISLELEAAI